MKTNCIICKKPATRTAEVGVCLEHWEGISRDTGAEVGLCTAHANCAIPILILNNQKIEEVNYGN